MRLARWPLTVSRFQYILITCASGWGDGSMLPFLGPYLYPFITYHLPYVVSTECTMWSTTYSTSAVALSAFLASSTVPHCCQLPCSGSFVCIGSCRLSAICSHVGDSVKRSMGWFSVCCFILWLLYAGELWKRSTVQSFVILLDCIRDSQFRPHPQSQFWLIVDSKCVRSPLLWMSVPVLRSHCSSFYCVVERWEGGLKIQLSSTPCFVGDDGAYIMLPRSPAYSLQLWVLVGVLLHMVVRAVVSHWTGMFMSVYGSVFFMYNRAAVCSCPSFFDFRTHIDAIWQLICGHKAQLDRLSRLNTPNS